MTNVDKKKQKIKNSDIPGIKRQVNQQQVH